MSITIIRKYKKDILIGILLAVIIWWLQSILLAPHLKYGFTPDDWWPLAHYNFLNSSLISNILQIWKTDGVYTSYQVFYISLLHHFFGFDFHAYQLTNHILKGLAALILYPLIVIVFKNRILAFLTSILYAMAYSPVGALELVVRGSDFIAIIFMCIFLIFYYFHITEKIKGWIWLIILTLFLSMSMLFSPIRIYPILIFILLVETYLIIMHRSKKTLFGSIKRLLFLFSPFILMLFLSPKSIIGFLNVNAPAIIYKISVGNWQLLLYPLGSFGSMFLLNDYWKIFGVIQVDTFINYVLYLLVNQLIIYLVIALFYSVILSIPSKQIIKFLFKILSINFILQLVIYFVVKHAESISLNKRMGYDPGQLYPVFFAVFILILSFWVWRQWRSDGKKNDILLALWLGPTFAIVFTVLIWIFKDWIVLFKGVHTYLNIASIGISLFIASTLVLFYQKIEKIRSLGKSLAPLIIFLILIPIFNINNQTIQTYWSDSNYAMDAKEQSVMRESLWNNLGNFDNSKPALFYFVTLTDRLNGRFYEQTMLGRFSEVMFFRGNYAKNKCLLPIFFLDKLDQLKNAVATENGQIGFNLHTFCGQPYFYSVQDFYAFELINKQAVNIKDKVLKQLGISY